MRALVGILAMLMTCGLVACGGDDGGGSGGGGSQSGKPVTLKVGVLPIVDVAALYLGRKQGFFEREKLTIKPQIMQGGAEVTTGVISGSLDLGFAATEPLAIARSKGLPVEIVTQGTQASENPEKASDGLMVRGNSAIRSPKDLEGKVIATNALQNMNELCTRAVLAREGVDVSKVKFLEVPFPEMTSALQSGRVDAITAVEPFVTQAESRGARMLLSFFAGLEPKLTIATFFGKRDYIDEHQDVIERFARAMNRWLTYAQQHPDEARQIILTYTQIPPPVAEKMNLPYWSEDLNRRSIQLVIDESKKLGFIERVPTLDELIWDRAAGGAASS